MKRILLILLIQLYVFVCFADEYKDPATNVIYIYDPAENRAEVKEGVDWEDTDDGTQGYDEPGSPDAKNEIVILDKFTVNGKEYIVDRIGSCAFLQMKNILSVTIPSTVKSIGYEAFFGCSSLSNVVLSEGLKSVEGFAFWGCESLTAISFPETLEKIEHQAFSECIKLKYLSIPANVTSIGRWSFLGCHALSDISVAHGNTHFDSRNDCNAIIETAKNKLLVGCGGTRIPDTVTNIGNRAFTSCKGLESICIPASVMIIEEYAFSECSNLKQLSLPEGLKTIGQNAFYYTGLLSVTIPSSVQSIGSAAFLGTPIQTIISLIENPFRVWKMCNASQTTLYVPAGTKSRYETTSGWNQFTNIVEMEANGIPSVDASNNSNASTSYDLTGRKVPAQQTKGIYIRKGKKAMKR